VTAHSHFRHGTISWEPGKVANEAIFTVNAAFRKEFNWGAYNKVCRIRQNERLRLAPPGNSFFYGNGMSPRARPPNPPPREARHAADLPGRCPHLSVTGAMEGHASGRRVELSAGHADAAVLRPRCVCIPEPKHPVLRTAVLHRLCR
jgi:hypothetical protein